MASRDLAGSRVLIVEDEYFLADDARSTLLGVGAQVIGPVPTAAEATALIEGSQTIDCVLLDINLGGEMAFGVADVLQARNVPFAFLTGYDREAVPFRFSAIPALAKPVQTGQLVALVERLIRPTRVE